MPKSNLPNDRFAIVTTLCAAVLPSTPNLQTQNSEMKNIVLVHGVWADGLGSWGVSPGRMKAMMTLALKL
jgi:hypothetical protein